MDMISFPQVPGITLVRHMSLSIIMCNHIYQGRGNDFIPHKKAGRTLSQHTEGYGNVIIPHKKAGITLVRHMLICYHIYRGMEMIHTPQVITLVTHALSIIMCNHIYRGTWEMISYPTKRPSCGV